MRGRAVVLGALLAVPMAGLALLIAAPSLDIHWEHRPSHFGLVLGVAVVNMLLGLLTSEAAHQRDDARLFLVSMALLASSGFLALHALATPESSWRSPTQDSRSLRRSVCSSPRSSPRSRVSISIEGRGWNAARGESACVRSSRR